MSVLPNATQNITTQAFLTSLVTNAGLLALQVGAFLYLKQRLERIYSPRTFLPPQPCVSHHVAIPVFDSFVLWSQEAGCGITQGTVGMASSHNHITFGGYREFLRCTYRAGLCLYLRPIS